MTEFRLEVGNSIIRSYKRLGYRPWYALAEFIDNSTQNYFENRSLLDAAANATTPPLEIRITYDRETLQIADTAMGMSEAELTRALRLGAPPLNTKGRSEYGLGLKTAACWFGDEWTIKTKKFGETKEYEVTVDVEKVADGKQDLQTTVREDLDPSEHHTLITIRKLHRRLHPNTVRRIETHIRSMYRMDLRNADLWVVFNDGEPIQPEEDNIFLRSATGAEYRKPYETTINGKAVRGWIGVLNPGARSKAGIAIIRRGRVILGQPHAWRPYTLFGEARNDLINQRLVGEIHLDEFRISHTKDEVLWEGDEEHDIEDYLESEFRDYKEQSRYKKKEQKHEGPTELDVQLGASEVKQQMESPEFADAISLQEVPSEEVVRASNEPLLRSASSLEPVLSARVGKDLCRVFLSFDASINDPYFASDFPANEIVVLVNANHHHFRRIQGPQAVANYFRECIYDALAQWKCMKQTAPVTHETIKFLKDGLLRLDVSTEEPLEKT